MIDALPKEKFYYVFDQGKKPAVLVSYDLEKLANIKAQSGRKDIYITNAYKVYRYKHEMESAGWCIFYPEEKEKYRTGMAVNKLWNLLIAIRHGAPEPFVLY